MEWRKQTEQQFQNVCYAGGSETSLYITKGIQLSQWNIVVAASCSGVTLLLKILVMKL